MLVLSRKTQQQIQIGPHVTITILKVKGETVRIGIEAPQEVCVLRPEVAGKMVHGESVSGETEATVRSALAATEREQARAARIAGSQPPVARRTSRIEFSSSLRGRSHAACDRIWPPAANMATCCGSGGRHAWRAAVWLSDRCSAAEPAPLAESSSLGRSLEMSIR